MTSRHVLFRQSSAFVISPESSRAGGARRCSSLSRSQWDLRLNEEQSKASSKLDRDTFRNQGVGYL